MRLHVISDFQLDANSDASFLSTPVDADICVVAGDANPPLHRSLMRLRDIAKRMPVVYVPGNRDFYNTIMPLEREFSQDLAREIGIHLLDDTHTIVDGVRFIGSTLWSEFNLPGRSRNRLAQAAIAGCNDYRMIRIADDLKLSVFETVSAFQHAKKFINLMLGIRHNGPTVVVSHTAPHPNSIQDKYQEDDLSGVFASDLSDILQSPNAPDLWIHGGMHANVDYVVGGTRVFSNSRGYAGENPLFDPQCVIDLPGPSITNGACNP